MHDRIKSVLSSSFVFIPVILLVYLVVVPMVLLLVSGFKPGGLVINEGFTLHNYIKLYSEPRTYRLMLNTLIFASGSSLLALFFSISLAWIVQRTNIPFKPLLRTAIITPMGIPMMLVAMGWALLASPRIGFLNALLMDIFNMSQSPLNIYSFPGLIFVQGIVMVPSSFLLLSATFNNVDPVFEEASSMSGAGPFSTLRRIVFPLLRPGILAVAITSFLVGLASFDIVGILGARARITVLSSEIYLATTQTEGGVPNFGMIGALSSVFFVLILLLTYFYNRQTKISAKFATITGREYRPKLQDLGKWKYAAGAFVGLYLLIAIVLPVASLIWQSLLPFYGQFSLDRLHLVSLDNYRGLLDYPRVGTAIRNTLIIAVSAASVLVLLATVISWIIVRSKYRARRVLDALSMLPMAIPQIMLGVALMFLYLVFKVGIYGTIWIIAIAYVTAYITYSTRTINSTLFQIHKDLEEVAQVSGASWTRVMRTIVLPLLTPTLIGLWVWILIHAMRELSAALMLQSSKNFVLTTLMWNMWSNAQQPMVATVGVCMVLFLFTVMGVGQILSRRFQIPTGLD
jgi:iron(III) transport system permease protein